MALTQHGTLYRPVIPAGQPLSQDIAGRHFYYVNGSGPILVKLDNMPASLLRPGQGLGPFPAPESFNRIEVSNPAGARMEISFWAGFTAFVDNRQDQVEARTELVPLANGATYADGILAAESSVDLLGSPTETLYRRKAVQVFNLDPAVSLYLTNLSDVKGGVIRAGESVTFPISGPVRVTNPAGAAVSCVISEIFWTL